MRATSLILVFVLGGFFPMGKASANGSASATGLLSVYADLYQGRPTASGAPYERAALTAAHATLPFGTLVRVANFESGRMVDLRVNDRKREDGRLITISRAAADAIGLDPNRTAPGSLLVIQGTAPAPPAVSPARATQAAAEPRRFRPLAGLFGKDAAPAGATTASSGQTLQYGIPGERFSPPMVPGWGPRFSQKVAVPAAGYPDPIPLPHGVAPKSNGGELLAMNARSVAPQQANPAPKVAPAPAVALPPASPSAPYRVQFGAFRRISSAEELSTMLDVAGIPTSIFAAPASGLNVVVTDGGFRTAEEAQGWIDFEGGRRGWTERPVVMR
jgi:rare lipoprotein A